MSKRKKKIKLPKDRHGIPIHVGDVLMWDGGETIRVNSLTYLGDAFKDMLGFCWVANDDEDGYSDNLSGGEIIWRG